jgi:hypothetical protein
MNVPRIVVDQANDGRFVLISGFQTNEAAWRWFDRNTVEGSPDDALFHGFPPRRGKHAAAAATQATQRATQRKAKTVSNELTPLGDFGGDDDRDSWIQGVLLKCVDGAWERRDGDDVPDVLKLLAVGTTEVVQHWRNKKPVETLILGVDDLPDCDELNEAIAKDEWEDGPGGKSPPWRHSCVVYLVDPENGETFTFANSTAGAWICFRELKDRVQMMARLRGHRVLPVVNLASKKMKTKFGVKQRPSFTIIEWRDLSGSGDAPPSLPAPTAPSSPLPATTSPQPAQPATSASPSSPPAQSTHTSPAKADAPVTVGRHVTEPTSAEIFDDAILF